MLLVISRGLENPEEFYQIDNGAWGISGRGKNHGWSQDGEGDSLQGEKEASAVGHAQGSKEQDEAGKAGLM